MLVQENSSFDPAHHFSGSDIDPSVIHRHFGPGIWVFVLLPPHYNAAIGTKFVPFGLLISALTVSKPMGKSTFAVGEGEKHSLTVDTDMVMKSIRIEVDGQKVIDDSLFSPGPKKFAFDVGSSEVHKVEVSLGMTRWAFGRKLTVLVDGKPVQSSSAGK